MRNDFESKKCNQCKHATQRALYYCLKYSIIKKNTDKGDRCEFFEKIGATSDIDGHDQIDSKKSVDVDVDDFEYLMDIIKHFRNRSHLGKRGFRQYLIIIFLFNSYIDNANFRHLIRKTMDSDALVSEIGLNSDEIIDAMKGNSSIVDTLNAFLPVTKRTIYRDMEAVEEKLKKMSQLRHRRHSIN